MNKIIFVLAVMSTIASAEYIYMCDDDGECKQVFVVRQKENNGEQGNVIFINLKKSKTATINKHKHNKEKI